MRKGVQPMMQLDPVESSYPSYDVSQSGSFSFRNFKLSKGGVETENGLLEHTIDMYVNRKQPFGGSSKTW